MELGEEILHENSYIWGKAETTPLDDVELIKRWFKFAQQNAVIPKHFALEVFTLPNPDKFEGDEMLVLYQEGQVWFGFPLSRFTSFTKNWSQKGLVDFLQLLFPENPYLGTEQDVGSEYREIDENNLFNEDTLEENPTDDEFNEDGFDDNEFNEDGFDDNEFNEDGFDDDDFNEDAFDDNDFNEDDFDEVDLDDEELLYTLDELDQTSQELVEDDSTRVLQELIKGINSQLDDNLHIIEECVEEAIQLSAKQMGSKKLVRLVLQVEEKLNDLKTNLSDSIETEEV